jgi:plastocyanin
MSPADARRLFVCVLMSLVIVPASAWGGGIKGTVRFTGAPIEQKTLPVTADQYVCGKEKEPETLVLSATKGIRNAVVFLRNAPVGAKWPAALPVQIDQKQCVYVPRVVVVPVGGTVEFLNSDRLLHNLHSVGTENRMFNRTQPTGRTIPIIFTKPEIVRIDCDLHSWMRAWVVVAEHPFYAITSEQGEFTLDHVPGGRYTLQVWQETLGSVTRDVAVNDQGITTVAVEMGQQ